MKSLGYDIVVPQGLKFGPEVEIKIYRSIEEEVEYVREKIGDSTDKIIGILSKDESYLKGFREVFKNRKNIFCLSFLESQGVEFEEVFIVGADKDMIGTKDVPAEIAAESQKIQRDLLYVALTRAMKRLYVIGNGVLLLP